MYGKQNVWRARVSEKKTSRSNALVLIVDIRTVKICVVVPNNRYHKYVYDEHKTKSVSLIGIYRYYDYTVVYKCVCVYVFFSRFQKKIL